jgi:hypothetical protein
MEIINTQYWVNSFDDEYEAFSNWRRSGYPQLKASPFCSGQGNYTFASGKTATDDNTHQGYRLTENAQEKVRESRWKQLQFWLSQKNIPSGNYIAVAMGLSSSEILTQFVRDHGERMADKFGKLPYFPGGHGRKLSEAWVRVMEVRA